MERGIQIQAKNETVNIYMYGYISEWDVSGKQLIDRISGYEGKYKKCNVYINSNGGSVPEGIALFNILSRTKMELSIYVDGIAASMGAVLVQVPGAKRYMSKYAKMMLHSVSGFASGSAKELRDTADMMDDFQGSLIEMVADRTEKSKRAVKNTWFDGTDHWFNAQEALDAGLVDGIVDGKAKEGAENVNNLVDAINFYDNQIRNFNKNTEKMDLTTLIAAAGMAADTTEEQLIAGIKGHAQKLAAIEAKLQKAETEKTALTEKIEQADKAKVANLVEAAITAKKITADQKESFVALATADFDNAKKVLDAMQGYEPINGRIGQEGNSPVKLTDDEKKYTFVDFQKKAPGKLQRIKDEMPETYKQLYENEYGQ